MQNSQDYMILLKLDIFKNENSKLNKIAINMKVKTIIEYSKSWGVSENKIEIWEGVQAGFDWLSFSSFFARKQKQKWPNPRYCGVVGFYGYAD
jgi:hypothetical protein